MEYALLSMSHRAARRIVASGAPVYLCVNPVEYHGPHLSLHNDRLLSVGIARRLAARLADTHDWPLLWADHLELGVDPCAGIGTRHLPLSLVRHAVVESCRALAELGARRVVLMTFHGAPLHNLALEAGAAWLRARGVPAIAPFHLVLEQMLSLDDPERFAAALDRVADDHQREAVSRELRHDFHAGFFETSLSLALAPDSVDAIKDELPPCPDVTPDPGLRRAAAIARGLRRHALARELEFGAVAMGWSALRPFPGYTGRPAMATVAAGERFADEIVRRYVETVPAVLEHDAPAPAPVMAWTERWSAGGRIGRPPPLRPEDLAYPDD